ncbi:Uncharacterized protein T07_3600 [Trichinella nelsoni]|uniref:Integrase catalytic domain-containing protein n=1 Tax=Trichinella nelsoni TaxID=6336 RepID=A0A0V0SGX5_9BILA|nr:Uncharacterized protein T07_3600 [Trichinella nelsoni]
MSVPLPTAAWDTLTVDLVGPIHSAPYGQWFAVTLIDYCSKWPEVHLCHAVTTKVIVNFLEDVFSREGYSEEIVSNDGVHYFARIQVFLGQTSIKHSKASLQANGGVEMKNCVQAAIHTL